MNMTKTHTQRLFYLLIITALIGATLACDLPIGDFTSSINEMFEGILCGFTGC
jgi:hypothetical protein